MRFFAPPQTRRDSPLASPTGDAVARRYGLDPASALTSRVRRTSASVLKMFKEAGVADPKAHPLSDAERRTLSKAFIALPPLHWRLLQERLRSVSFLDGMPNTALTSTVNPDEAYPLFDITIRAGVLRQTASEWLTEKERSLWETANSPLRVSIEAGETDALIFVLLHEATHIVDLALGITPSTLTKKGQEYRRMTRHPFTDGVWSSRTLCAPPYRDALRERIRFYADGKTIPIGQASAVYASLQKTPFVSLYGSSNWGDDLAEYVAVTHWTRILRQPYRIVLRNSQRVILTCEPMRSPLVRGRLPLTDRFYE